MNKYLIKIGLFLAFCVLSVIIIACSDEFVVSNLEGEKIATTSELEKVTGFEASYGFRDSVPFLMLAINGDTSYDVTKFDKANELVPFTNALARTRQFKLKWNEVIGAVDYDVRVYNRKINKVNWYKAQTVEILETNNVDGEINAIVTFNPIPEVMSGKCTGCGKCYENCPTNAISMEGAKAVINKDKCIECGECFRSCEFDAIKGTFPGSVYYVAIRSINENDEYSEEITTLSEAIKLRYVTITEVSDEEKDPAFSSMGGCLGNCSFTGCFIAFPTNDICKPIDNKIPKRVANREHIESPNSVCPVDAIFEIDSSTVDESITKYGAILIDKDKCINCGRCVMQCFANGNYGSVTSEIVKAVSRIF